MPRIRTIKPEFWAHEDLSELPAETHMLAAALLNYADDEGYFNANPKLVKAVCCPLRDDSMSIHGGLNQLSSVGYIRLGTGEDGKRYGMVEKFKSHQVISRPTASKISGLQIKWDDSMNTHGVINEDSLPERKGKERKGREGIGADKPRKAERSSQLPDDFVPNDTNKRVASEQSVSIDRELPQFVDYHKAKGTTMKDWHRAFNTWLRNANKFGGGKQAAPQGNRPSHKDFTL